MKKFLSSLASLALSLAAVAAYAGEITLYTNDNFSGPSLQLRDTEPDLARRGFNDRASSVVVRSGNWEICEHANFAGRCMLLQPGEYARLEGFNDQMSSLRELQRGGGRDDRGGWGGHDGRGDRGYRGDDDYRKGWGGRRDDAITLFAQADFRGRKVGLERDARTLDDYDFNDSAGSIIVNEGVWQVCEHADFRGRCITLQPGRYDRLDRLNNNISSLRRVR